MCVVEFLALVSSKIFRLSPFCYAPRQLNGFSSAGEACYFPSRSSSTIGKRNDTPGNHDGAAFPLANERTAAAASQ